MLTCVHYPNTTIIRVGLLFFDGFIVTDESKNDSDVVSCVRDHGNE